MTAKILFFIGFIGLVGLMVLIYRILTDLQNQSGEFYSQMDIIEKEITIATTAKELEDAYSHLMSSYKEFSVGLGHHHYNRAINLKVAIHYKAEGLIGSKKNKLNTLNYGVRKTRNRG